MDDPGLERSRHLQALGALARINRVSLVADRVWADVLRLHRREGRPIRVLDVACGGGDVLHRVARRAERGGVAVELHGCDVSSVALDAARASAPHATPLHFFRLDVLQEELPEGFDLICSSLFLHHLAEESAVHLLRGMAAATVSSLLIQDLRRTRLGYLLASAGILLLTRSEVVKSDGPASVEGAFTMAEAAGLCDRADLQSAEVRPCWPQRYTIRWDAA